MRQAAVRFFAGFLSTESFLQTHPLSTMGSTSNMIFSALVTFCVQTMLKVVQMVIENYQQRQKDKKAKNVDDLPKTG